MINTNFALLDANILIYAINKDLTFYKSAKSLRDKAISGKILTCITPQVLWEFFAVVTDKKRTTKPLTSKQAQKEVLMYWQCHYLKKIFVLEKETDTILKLIEKYNIQGQHIHDVRLISTMLDNNVKIIYSADETLKKFKEIKLINPFK